MAITSTGKICQQRKVIMTKAVKSTGVRVVRI
jgi:hypothetical protein